MDKNKYVKLSAIERIAKPMDAFHGKDDEGEKEEEYESEGHEVECPKCGHEFECSAEDEEYEEEE